MYRAVWAPAPPSWEKRFTARPAEFEPAQTRPSTDCYSASRPKGVGSEARSTLSSRHLAPKPTMDREQTWSDEVSFVSGEIGHLAFEGIGKYVVSKKGGIDTLLLRRDESERGTRDEPK